MSKRDSNKTKNMSSRSSVNKRISHIMEEENTTNSEMSDQTEFSDVNWDENIEIDALEVDEFAPQTIPKSGNGKVQEVSQSSERSEGLQTNELDCGLVDVESPNDFHIGLHLMIMNYKTNEWTEGVVEEIDLEEEEVLISSTGGENSEEWMSMTSHRIKKMKSVSKLPASQDLMESSINEVQVDESLPLQIPEVSDSSSLPVSPPSSATGLRPSTVIPLKKSNKARKKLTLKKIKRGVKNPSFKKSKPNTTTSSKAKYLPSRLPIWKSHSPKDTQSSIVYSGNKFKEGEKVLAKWSDHRMQKFPAVVKRVCGGGLYDVLFYDGFEKTICEDNLYKTTDEEMEKYQGSKPSEADSFVDVDVSSKHERRQKKRKTFDGFYEDKDFKRPKKIEEKGYDLNHSESFLRASLSRNKPNIQSFSVHNQYAKKFSPITKPVISTPKSSTSPRSVNVSTPKLGSTTPVRTSPSMFSKQPIVLTPKLSPSAIPISPVTSTTSLSPASAQVSPVPVSPKSADNPQKTSDQETPIKSLPSTPPSHPDTEASTIENTFAQDTHSSEETVSADDSYFEPYPLEITCHDGVVRKSILIEDDKLPYGWTKHVIAWVDNVWACFLFTPDRYAVHSLIELRKYFRMTENKEPPEGLDFSFPKESLLEIANDQKDLEPQSYYRKWVNKILDERKITKKVRILPPSRSLIHGGHFNTKRVRTLLPKHRSLTFNQGHAVKTFEGKLWKCPKEDCGKKFRKENLLHMHIKHYHRELRELAGSAPKVSDLAFARTSSDPIFSADSTPQLKRCIPKSPMPDHTPTTHSSTDINGAQPSTSFSPGIQSELKSSLPLVSGTGSLKVLTPVKNKNRLEDESSGEHNNIVDSDSTSNDKFQLFSPPKVNSKKSLDSKSLEDSYSGVNKGLVKKKPQVEKVYAGDINESLYDEELKDEDIVIERLQTEEIINCICGFKEEDGLMVQCEICLCWQHGACHGIEKDSDVPEPYVCTVCLDPLHIRSSQKYSYANHYLTVSKLPRFNHRTCKEEVLREREKILSKSFELTSNLQSIHKMERTLTAKINIAQQKDHPKLYLWSANWDDSKKKQSGSNLKKSSQDSVDKGKRGPVGEAPIENIDCRLRLLDRIEADQQDLESRLTIIQAKLQALESEDFDLGGEDEEGNRDPLLKQAVYMLLRDLSTISTATSLS